MPQTTIPAIQTETLTTCRAMPIWLASPSTGTARIAVGRQTLPVSPCVTIIDRIPTADFRRKTAGPEGPPFACAIELADVRPQRVTLSPFVPKEQISLVAFPAKPGNACGPRTNGPGAIAFGPQPGVIDRRGHPPGGELRPEPPIACEPRTERDAWRPKVLKPSDPVACRLASIPFSPQAGSSAEVRRPKQALRELVLPSPRPWHSLTIPWQSFRGFHLALPLPEATTRATIQAPDPAVLWNTAGEMPLLGRRFLQEWQELAWEHEPSRDGARTELSAIKPVAAVEPFSPGFNQVFQGDKPALEHPEPFTNIATEALPLSESALAPAPAVALSTGLPIWTGTINSYMQRNLCPPRLREGGRVVHMLRLAPAVPDNKECKISAA